MKQEIISIERAIGDLRRGYPISIREGKKQVLALSPETTSSALIKEIASLTKTTPHLVITQQRFQYLYNKNTGKEPISITLADIKKIALLSGLEKGKAPLPGKQATTPASSLQKSALTLIKLAELLPAVITFTPKNPLKEKYFLEVKQHSIRHYKTSTAKALQEICRTRLTLAHAKKAEMIAFRASGDGKEHYAIVIGNALSQKSPLVRIHSSCYTGDLLASLSCDCRDQLHSAITRMGEGNGGIILYLLQEGRGIGLTNKLRAYQLKAEGLDTVDANEALGFDDDERLFQPAAEILKRLKIKQVNLLTNNPKKAKGLEEFGIIVTKTVSHIMETNEHNKAYLKTKKERLGHKV